MILLAFSGKICYNDRYDKFAFERIVIPLTEIIIKGYYIIIIFFCQ